jgi:anti-sigma factor RsiW
MKTNGNDNLHLPEHIESEDLIAYLDGELGSDASTNVRRHIESCWDCRNRLTAVERSIERFLDLRRESLVPREIPPSGPSLELFRQRLAAHRELTPAQSFFRKLSHHLTSIFDVANYPLRTQALLARGLAAAALIGVIASLVLFSGRLNPVSASELLRLAAEAQSSDLARTDQPVIHQRITVRSTRSAEPVTWEIWNDTQNSRVRVSEPPVATGGFLAPTQGGIIQDVRAILRTNSMNEYRPLSAASYRSWTDSLPNKTEQVTKADDIFTIQTTPGGQIAVGRIIEARLTVRALDYHPRSLTIKTRTLDGDIDFELTETEYHIASLRDIAPTIFADATKIEPTTARLSEPAVATGSNANTDLGMAASTSPVANTATAAPATATLETEVEVIKALDSTGALSSGQVNVTRSGGQLRVSGVVDTAQRKAEIVNSLAEFRTGRGVVVEIETLEEAAARRTTKPAANVQISTETVEVDTALSMPVENELKAALQKRGVTPENMGREMRAVADAATAAASAVRRDALALKQIAERFTPAEIERLDPAKREEWKTLIRTRARSVAANVRSLNSQLGSIFPGMQNGDTGSASDNVVENAQRLFGLAAACDQSVSQSFAISAAGKGSAPVRTPQFWRNLAQMATLAGELQK